MSKIQRFLRIFLWSFILGVLVNTTYSTFPSKFVDKELQPYVTQVQTIANMFCEPYEMFLPNRTSVIFGELGSDILGVCYRTPFVWQIKIDKTAWKTMPEDERQTLLFHELTHCLFKEKHVLDKYPHYMNESIYKIPMEEVRTQFLQIVDKHCKGKL